MGPIRWPFFVQWLPIYELMPEATWLVAVKRVQMAQPSPIACQPGAVGLGNLVRSFPQANSRSVPNRCPEGLLLVENLWKLWNKGVGNLVLGCGLWQGDRDY